MPTFRYIDSNQSTSLDTLHAGEPFPPKMTRADSCAFLHAGEDLVADRMNVTILDWAKMVNDGWRTKTGIDKDEMKKVLLALQTYLQE